MNKYNVFPTMITPYQEDGSVDYEAVKTLTKWYARQGCTGIFAVCQSSESMFLTLEERVNIACTVVETAKSMKAEGYDLTIVASGHISDGMEEQKRELVAMSQTGIDGLIFVSNRFDIENTSDEKWIADMLKAVEWLPEDLPLGVYECPKPYKRLMSKKMLQACLDTGRFAFMKDTCCDIDIIRERLELLKGSMFALYNANAQTLLQSMQSGAAGYCGVMANFHPALYAKLCEICDVDQAQAEKIQAFFTVSAFTESLCYPVTAKYHLDKHEGISMTYHSRSADETLLTNYQKSCIDDMATLVKYMEQ